MTPAADATRDLPSPTARILEEVIAQARRALGDMLRSIVLFGSAAENRLRATSDVNLLIVITAFDPARAATLAALLQSGHAAVGLSVMWLTDEEIVPASEAFADKFADIIRRHRLLYGVDPFVGLRISRGAALARVRQALLNQLLRLRASYVMDHDREERLTLVVADAAGPLRVSAAELLELEERPAATVRAALEHLAGEWSAERSEALLASIRVARETRRLDPGAPARVLADLIDLVAYLHRRARALA